MLSRQDVADDGRLSAYVEGYLTCCSMLLENRTAIDLFAGDPPDQDEEPAALAMLTEERLQQDAAIFSI